MVHIPKNESTYTLIHPQNYLHMRWPLSKQHEQTPDFLQTFHQIPEFLSKPWPWSLGFLKDNFLVLGLENQVLGLELALKANSLALALHVSTYSHPSLDLVSCLFSNSPTSPCFPGFQTSSHRVDTGCDYAPWHQWRKRSVSSNDTTFSVLPLTNGSFR